MRALCNRLLSPAEIAQDAALSQAALTFSAALSTDGGLSFQPVDASSVSLTGVDGTTSTETLTARGLALVESASLDAPLNIVRLSAADLAGRTTDFYFSVLADTTPPTVSVSSPAAGSVFSALAGSLTPSVAASDRLDPAPAVTGELVQLEDAGGNGVLDRVAVSTGIPFNASLLDPGAWELLATALDFAGNASVATSGAFRVESDLLPPRTVLLVEGPQVSGVPLFVSQRSTLTLSAVDDLLVLGDGVGVGVAGSSYSIASPAAYMDYAGAFTLPEGTYDLRTFSTDLAGHVEAVQLSSIAVDGTGPAVALEFHAPFRILAGTDTVFVQGLGPLALSATDFPALAVGTTAVYLSVDGGPAVSAAVPFSLPFGPRALAFWAVDALGNQGSTVTAALKLDDQPPAAVADLALLALSSTAMKVSWTAPGDDGAQGDIFDAAVRLDFGSNPATLDQSLVLSSGTLAAGTAFARTFTGLSPATTYYAVAYTRDSAGNWSAPSALAAAPTFSVSVSQDGVATVASPVPVTVSEISTVTAATQYAVAVASQGLAPAGNSFYELTSGLSFSPEAPALISFTFNPALVDPASVAIYTFDGVAWSSASIFNQTLTVVSASEYLISGEIFHTSLYAPMVRDTSPPLTSFSVAGSSSVLEGRLFAVGGSSGVLSALDLAPLGGVPSGVAATLYRGGGGPELVYNAPFALPEGRRDLSFHSLDTSGNAETEKQATVFVDATAPLLAFALDQATFPVPGGFGTLSSTVTLTFAVQDPQVGGASSGLGTVSLTVDGAAADFSNPVFLGAGLHSLLLSAGDRLGNTASLTLKAAVGDTLAPVTTLAVGAPKFTLPGDAVLVSAATALELSAEDFAQSGVPSGVAQTSYRFAVADAFAPYNGAFSAPEPDGPKTVQYFSTDRAGNAETPKTAALVRDGTPPALAFAFPRQDEPGLCRLAQGKVEVRGSVADEHLAAWSLSDDPVLLGSGTANTEGLLGVWDAAGKTGAFTLNLSAADLVENSASVSLSVHAGQPAQTLALGGKKALNKPRGVAWAPNRIYVADTGSDLIRVYDAVGNLLSSFGGGKKGGLKLNKPAGLAVDLFGNVFVADTNNKRVVKLSPAGFLLQEFGGKKLLEKPVAVALVPGKVLVADSHTGEVVVFSEAGALLARLSLPPASRGHEDEDEEDEARPMALAAEGPRGAAPAPGGAAPAPGGAAPAPGGAAPASGAVWVADAKGGRVLRYDAELNLTQTIPGFARPEGLAVSPSGACLAVTDAKTGTVRTFDAATGAELAAFGRDSLRKPAQAVFTADGQLLVADRNEDMISGFGLPGTPLVLALAKDKDDKQERGKGFRASAVEDASPASPPVTARIGKLEGGLLEQPGGAAVEIPSGALAQDQDISVAVAEEAGVAERQSLNLAAVSAPREFGPHGLSFAVPVTITLPYESALLAGASPAELKIHYWNEGRGAWEALASQVDTGARTVSAQTTHFSLYQVLAPIKSLGVLSDPEATFSLRSVYAFPNPAVRGQKPTFHAAVGKADRVTIRIYDIAGTPVHETTLDGTPSIVNDDTGAHYAYEYAWDGHIPSGVYLYVVTAEKAGNAPIKRIGKLAVVR